MAESNGLIDAFFFLLDVLFVVSAVRTPQLLVQEVIQTINRTIINAWIRQSRLPL